VATLPTALGQGDSIFVGSGPNAQNVLTTASASKGATTIAVSALPANAAVNSSVYDSALTNVPNTVPTTLSASASSGATSLTVPSLPSAVSTGDTIVVGTGTTAQTVTATANASVSAGSTTIAVTALPASAATSSEVYDSTCSPTEVSQIQAVALNLVATKTPGGQPTGYQSLAYFVAPAYSASVG